MRKLLLSLVSIVVIIMSVRSYEESERVFRHYLYKLPPSPRFATVKPHIITTTKPPLLTVSKANREVTTSILTRMRYQRSRQNNRARYVKPTKTRKPFRTTTTKRLPSPSTKRVEIVRIITSTLLPSSSPSSKIVTTEQSLTSSYTFSTKTSHLTTRITTLLTIPKETPNITQRGSSIQPTTTTSSGWLFILPQAEVKNAAGRLMTHKEYSAQTMDVPRHE